MGLEPTSLAATDFKSVVYTIPPSGHVAKHPLLPNLNLILIWLNLPLTYLRTLTLANARFHLIALREIP